MEYPAMSALQRIFRRYIQQNVSGEEKALVERWYDAEEQSPIPELTGHEEHLIRNRLWSGLVVQLGLQRTAAGEVEKEGGSGGHFLRYAAAAAIIGLILSITVLINRHTRNEPRQNEFTEIRTHAGEWRKILLPDSSIIKLSPNSYIRFFKTFDGAQREILAAEGEAWYDVAHDSLRPFIIHAGQLTVRVLGTSFNISNIPGWQEQSVLVKQGRVQVQQRDKILSTLTRGKQLILDTTNGRFRINDHKELVAERMEQGWLILENISWPALQVLIRSRYNAHIIDNHHKMEGAFFTASFKPGTSLFNVMQVLCGIHGLTFTLKDNLVTIED